jgi:hypothetical protein
MKPGTCKYENSKLSDGSSRRAFLKIRAISHENKTICSMCFKKKSTLLFWILIRFWDRF